MSNAKTFEMTTARLLALAVLALAGGGAVGSGATRALSDGGAPAAVAALTSEAASLRERVVVLERTSASKEDLQDLKVTLGTLVEQVKGLRRDLDLDRPDRDDDRRRRDERR